MKTVAKSSFTTRSVHISRVPILRHLDPALCGFVGFCSIRTVGAISHLPTWMKQEATVTVLRLLDAAAEYDSATSGYNPKSNIYPTVKTITKDGIQDLSVERLQEIYAESVETTYAR